MGIESRLSMMRYRDRHNSRIPDVNLVPMLDVLMTVLTFFIIISMTLGTQQGVPVQLPNNPESPTPPQATPPPQPLIVDLTPTGILLEETPVTLTQLKQQMQVYLTRNPEGVVILKAAPEMPYEQVVQLLGDMKAIGKERVSLAIDE